MKPDIFEIFRNFSRYLEKKNEEFPETYLGHFSWYLYLGLTTWQVVETSVTVNNDSGNQDCIHPNDQTQPTSEYFNFKVSFYEDIVQSFLILKITLLYS